MKWVKGSEEGFTLVELLVAIPIAALVVAAATGIIIQILNGTHNTSHMLAMRQVQTAGDWVSRDSIQTQNITLGAGNGFPFNLTWTDWDDNEVHQIIYSLLDMPSGGLKQLQRHENINGTTSATTTVAQYIDASATSCQWEAEQKVLTFTVMAKVDQQTESREYEIKPRVLLH